MHMHPRILIYIFVLCALVRAEFVAFDDVCVLVWRLSIVRVSIEEISREYSLGFKLEQLIIVKCKINTRRASCAQHTNELTRGRARVHTYRITPHTHTHTDEHNYFDTGDINR